MEAWTPRPPHCKPLPRAASWKFWKRRRWALTAPYKCFVDHKKYELRVGFEWDGSTSPWFTWLFFPAVGPDFEESPFHDEWCRQVRNGELSAKEANDRYNALMKGTEQFPTGVSDWGRWCRYKAVNVYWRFVALFNKKVKFNGI